MGDNRRDAKADLIAKEVFMQGFFKRLLRINLKTKTYKTEPIADSILEQYLGGKGLSIYLLLNENPVGVDPLSPKNKMIFALGPATDSRIYGSCRHGAFTKSPLTGIFSESYSGGKSAEPMSRTGYDAFIVEEASDEPIWLEISDEQVLFHDAKDLWGKDTYSTEDEVDRPLWSSGPPARISFGMR